MDATDKRGGCVTGGEYQDQDDANGVKLRRIINDEGNFDKRVFLGSKYTAYWLSVQGTTVIGTVITATDYCYFLSVHYNVNTPTLQRKCDG